MPTNIAKYSPSNTADYCNRFGPVAPETPAQFLDICKMVPLSLNVLLGLGGHSLVYLTTNGISYSVIKISNRPYRSSSTTVDFSQPQDHLQVEWNYLTYLKGVSGIPFPFCIAVTPPMPDLRYTYFTAKWTGYDLICLRKKLPFDVHTVMKIIGYVLSILEQIHDKGVIHYDIKPNNITMDPNLGPSSVHIIDFGMAQQWGEMNTLSSEYFAPLPKKKGCLSTPVFASIWAHKGLEPSQRDDLDSLFYSAIYLLHGKLPWQKDKSLEVMHKAKINTFTADFFIHLPKPLSILFNHTRSLGPKQRPNYDFLKDTFLNT